jgi:hypothetical protein
MRLAVPLALLSLLVLACGGKVVIDGAGAGGSVTTSTGGGGCISPSVGEACSQGDVACQPANPCCAGYEWTCTGGAWEQAGLGCACMTPPPFACGMTTCAVGDLCEVHPPGIAPPDGGVPPDVYTCSPLPGACASTPTCACLGATISSGDPCSPGFGAMCTVDADGNVTVVCLDV